METTPRRDAAPQQRRLRSRRQTSGLIVAVVVTLLAALVPMFTSPASAASVTPDVRTSGNNTCGALWLPPTR